MKYCVLLSQTDEPAKIVPCTTDDVLGTCYQLIDCDTVQLVPNYPDRLPKGYEALCDANTYGKTLFINPLASWIYGVDEHGSGIFGNAVVLKTVRNDEDEEDLDFMTEEEAKALEEELNKDFDNKYDMVYQKVLIALMKD